MQRAARPCCLDPAPGDGCNSSLEAGPGGGVGRPGAQTRSRAGTLPAAARTTGRAIPEFRDKGRPQKGGGGGHPFGAEAEPGVSWSERAKPCGLKAAACTQVPTPPALRLCITSCFFPSQHPPEPGSGWAHTGHRGPLTGISFLLSIHLWVLRKFTSPCGTHSSTCKWRLFVPDRVHESMNMRQIKLGM